MGLFLTKRIPPKKFEQPPGSAPSPVPVSPRLSGLSCRSASPKSQNMTHRRSEEDRERLAAALRANLARRKAQTRQRQADDSPPDARLRPTEAAPEPGGSAGGPGGAGEGTHDSAGFVGDKPSG
jgi:hypothetical protein